MAAGESTSRPETASGDAVDTARGLSHPLAGAPVVTAPERPIVTDPTGPFTSIVIASRAEPANRVLEAAPTTAAAGAALGAVGW